MARRDTRTRGLLVSLKDSAAEDEVRALATGTDIPYDVELVARRRGGRYELTSLRAERVPGGPEVTGEGLRALPVRKLLRMAVSVMVPSTPLGSGEAPYIFGTDPPREKLRTIASVYRAAVLIGDPPTIAVADSFSMPRSTAARWIARARSEGFLGPATPGKAGEAGAAKRKRAK